MQDLVVQELRHFNRQKYSGLYIAVNIMPPFALPDVSYHFLLHATHP
jgi:hypothetical protein